MKREYVRGRGFTILPSSHSIHPECAQAIRRLIQLKDPKREDFLELRTYGTDRYSAMGWDELRAYINEQTIVIVEQFENEQNIMSALRWVARGLPVWLAIRKVRADYSVYGYKGQK
ncbi:hypothetical protein [Brevibacillus reuszeri]|uniref:hypothetical protein n=1 Tax=Brevibacillus reuszeri TaxID=54915 RepID=UPI000CCC6EDB|nr:hypothetical protein [Brevibacillus reuszeri]